MKFNLRKYAFAVYSGTMFELNEYLSEQRSLIDEALQRMLPQKSEKPAVLHEAMRYSVFSGGKRLRPILALAAAGTLEVEPSSVINAAIAVEILHTYTLIHDDLPSMDDDDERRGKPTCHKVFGEANAILAGDALQALAFETAAQTPLNPAQVVLELARAAGSCGVVGGQVADISAPPSPSTAEIEFIHTHKTGDLFRAAIRMGAIAADASEQQLEKLTCYGSAIGAAFQIIDDILDADDETDDSFSCIGIYGLEGAKKRAAELTHTAVTALDTFGENSDALCAIANHMLERTC
jgi:geranylgeranyl diphosphate synthase type II